MRLIILIALLTSLAASAAPREWRNLDASRVVRGEVISRDATSVLIRRSRDLKESRLPLSEMHPEDLAWLNQSHPLPNQPKPKQAVSDTSKELVKAIQSSLVFGENITQVTKRLKANALFETTLDETFYARTGLNGIFRTKQKIANQNSQLYFGWNDRGGLKDFTLHTDSMSLSKSEEQLLSCWQAYIDIITEIHGEPLNESPKLVLKSIPEDGIIFTHLWESPKTGTILIGASHDRQGYQIALRFTSESYQAKLK